MKKLNKDKKKKTTYSPIYQKLNKDKKKKTTYSPIYQKMYDAIGNEEIFWEWFWERMFDSEPAEDFEKIVKHRSAAGILLGSFFWPNTQSGDEFWGSLYDALLKAGK